MLYPDSTYRSHFGVYALVLSDKKDSVLLIKKALGCYTGLYDLPGGSMEPHETLEETLYREVFEETGCHIKSAEQFGTFSTFFPYMDNGQKTVLRHLAAIYTATIAGTPRSEGAGNDDSHGCVWIPIVDLHEKNATPIVLAPLKKYAQQ